MQSLQLQPQRSQSSPETSPLPVVHQVKEWPRYFADLIAGWPAPLTGRPYELRQADRPTDAATASASSSGDPNAAGGAGAATGRSALARILWVSDEWAQLHLLPTDLVLFGVELLQVEETFPPAAGPKPEPGVFHQHPLPGDKVEVGIWSKDKGTRWVLAEVVSIGRFAFHWNATCEPNNVQGCSDFADEGKFWRWPHTPPVAP